MADLDWPSIAGHGKSDESKALLELIAEQEGKVQIWEKKIARLSEAVASSTQEIQPLVAALEKAAGEKDAITAEIKKTEMRCSGWKQKTPNSPRTSEPSGN
ncbi:MAG: hypothetical protein WCG76_04365 [Verrucomicrobiota bacterium]